MYHLRLKGKHYDMGFKRGSILKKCGIHFPLNVDSFQLNHGIKSEIILNKNFKEVCEEMHGLCDALELDYARFSAWMLAMGCCMYNLDENIPVEIRGCTAFALNYHNEYLFYGRNNDLPPFLEKGSKSEIYKPINGNSFNITTSSLINGEEGINDKGLVVAMTFVLTKLKDIKPGFNAVFIVRYLLEKANDVESALKLLMDLEIASNCNILLIDKNKEMAVVECSPSKKNIRRAIDLGNDTKAICTVNSFTSTDMKKYEWTDENDFKSDTRYNTVVDSLKTIKDVKDKNELIIFLEELLKGKHGFICQYPKSDNFKTVWSSIFDLETLEIYRAEGDPRKNKFILDKRLESIKNKE